MDDWIEDWRLDDANDYRPLSKKEQKEELDIKRADGSNYGVFRFAHRSLEKTRVPRNKSWHTTFIYYSTTNFLKPDYDIFECSKFNRSQ